MSTTRTTCLIALAILLGAATAAFGQAANKPAEFTGYLTDGLCGKAGYPDGYKDVIDLVKNPDNHVILCLTMDNCKAKGYGIFVKGDDGMYVFRSFDKKGSDLAYKNVVAKFKTTDKVPLLKVTGTLKNGVIAVKTVEVAAAGAAATGGTKPMGGGM